jgi:exopolysaccharide biosynthesis polyprenyl glycosylphosphotransferase
MRLDSVARVMPRAGYRAELEENARLIPFLGVLHVFGTAFYENLIETCRRTGLSDGGGGMPVGGRLSRLGLTSGDPAMTKLFGHSVRSELLCLYLAEFLVCFSTIYIVLTFGAGYAQPLPHVTALTVAAILALCSGLVTGASGLYQPSAWRRAGRFFGATLFAALLLLLIAQASLLLLAPLPDAQPPFSEASLVLLALLSAILLTHLAFAAIARSGALKRRVVVLRGADGSLAVEREFSARAPSFDIFEVALVAGQDDALHPDLTPAQLRAMRVRAVIAADPAQVPATTRAGFVRAGVKLVSEAEFCEQRLSRVDLARLPSNWLAMLRPPGLIDAALRRALDIAGSLVLLLVTLPLLLVVALAIRLDSPGPALYRQSRVGKGGRVFTLYKFRSMVVDAEAGSGPRWASKRDPRVTRIGYLIRRTRIDEIPQAWNVLKGDMALVGPRPERPGIVDGLARDIPHYNDRAVVRPGITGWAQVNFPYGASVEDSRMKLAYDLYYVQRRSLFLDLLILVATVRVVLFQEGSR